MNKSKIKVLAVCIAIPLIAGAVSALLTMGGVKVYNDSAIKPFLSPPPIVFPIVWTVLYVVMGISLSRVYMSPMSEERSKGILLFGLQLFFNFFWSIIFFNIRNYAFAFVWLAVLWVLIALMIRSFYKVDKTSALLQIPYLVWVTFAGYLNFGVWLLNR